MQLSRDGRPRDAQRIHRRPPRSLDDSSCDSTLSLDRACQAVEAWEISLRRNIISSGSQPTAGHWFHMPQRDGPLCSALVLKQLVTPVAP